VSIATWMKFDRFDPETDFARWVTTIARYEMLNHRHTKARDRSLMRIFSNCWPMSDRKTSLLFLSE